MKPDERLNGSKVYVNGMSKAIQEIAFERGYVNDEGKKEVVHTDAPFLYFKKGKIRYGYDMEEYSRDFFTHSIDAREFVEKFMDFGLKPFQKVLVRNSDEDIWRCDFFSHKEEDTHAVEVGYTKHDTTTKRYVCVTSDYKQCIPYEGNEHLLGTADHPAGLAMEEELCWNCGGEGCRLCGYTGTEPAGEADWLEAAKEAAGL